MSIVSAYPLAWPAGFARTKSPEASRFKATLPQALKNVQDSLRRFSIDTGKKLDGLVISSNVTLGAERPSDAGVSVWFTWDGLQVCIPVDRYKTVADNLQAIYHIIEARRVELRHGTLALVRATFQGFTALPPPNYQWWDVLECTRDATREVVEANYRRLAKDRHPDAGGSADAMSRLNEAKAAALKEIGR